jgi:hypothetical protein
MLDNTEAIPYGAYYLKFTIENRSFSHLFAIMDCSHPLLLGTDFLHQFGFTFDFGDLVWGFSDSFHEQKFKLKVDTSNTHTTHNLMLLQDFEQDEITKLLKEFPDVLDAPLGRIKGIKHRIKLIEERPKRQRPYPTSPFKHEEICRQTDEMLKLGIIRKSESPYAHPVLLRDKPDGSWRFCIDYRHINKLTPNDSFPMPRIQDLLRKLGEAKYLSTMDAEKGYWQIPMEAKSRKYTAFVQNVVYLSLIVYLLV